MFQDAPDGTKNAFCRFGAGSDSASWHQNMVPESVGHFRSNIAAGTSMTAMLRTSSTKTA
jgi:hypothetical protein